MAAARQKPAELLINRRGGRGREFAVVPRPDGWRMPPLPKEISEPLVDAVQGRLQAASVRHARATWRDWWHSPASWAVKSESDQEAIRWWILCIYRRHLYVRLVQQQPIVKGSMGQLVANPLEKTITQLTADIAWAADRFGMTPIGRFRLNLTYTEAGQSADRLEQILRRREFEEERSETMAVVRVIS